MPTYKVVDADQLDADLKIVADAIRAKGGTSDSLPLPYGMKSAIEAISSGGGDALIKAGVYNLLNYDTGWSGEQLIKGTINGYTHSYTNESYDNVPFEKIVTDGNLLDFYDGEGSRVASISMMNFYSGGTITITEVSIVSSDFGTWWNANTEIVSSGGTTGGETTYTLSGTWKQTVECYDTIVVHGNISGTVTVSGTENSFRSITYTGLGEPYIYFYSGEYYQGGSSDATYTAHTIHPISVNFGETEQEVDKSFYNWFTKYFTKVDDSGGDDGGGDSGTTYTLSGSWRHTKENYPGDAGIIKQDISGSVTGDNNYISSDTYSFTAIECNTEGEPYINFYNGSSSVASTPAHTVFNTVIDFGNTAQEVSAEFYNWFTSSFTKVEDSGGGDDSGGSEESLVIIHGNSWSYFPTTDPSFVGGRSKLYADANGLTTTTGTVVDYGADGYPSYTFDEISIEGHQNAEYCSIYFYLNGELVISYYQDSPNLELSHGDVYVTSTFADVFNSVMGGH